MRFELLHTEAVFTVISPLFSSTVLSFPPQIIVLITCLNLCLCVCWREHINPYLEECACSYSHPIHKASCVKQEEYFPYGSCCFLIISLSLFSQHPSPGALSLAFSISESLPLHRTVSKTMPLWNKEIGHSSDYK